MQELEAHTEYAVDTIAPKPYTLTARGLTFEGEPTWEEFEALFSKPVWESLIIDEVHDGLPFIIGDALNRGEEIWEEGYTQIYNHFNEFKHQTLYNYKSVCGKVPAHVRSHAKHVVFSHHAAVARFWAEQDKQSYYLGEAEKHYMTVAELRAFIRKEEKEDEETQTEFEKAIDRALNVTGKLYDFPITHDGREALAVIRNAIQDFAAAEDVPDEEE